MQPTDTTLHYSRKAILSGNDNKFQQDQSINYTYAWSQLIMCKAHLFSE